MSLEMAHKVILPPQKKIISRSFLNSGTLIVKDSVLRCCTHRASNFKCHIRPSCAWNIKGQIPW
jgi:hypothetical protein